MSNAPLLTGLVSTVSADENDVNAGSVRLDASVVFTDANGDFNGGKLFLTGLLAEDVVSVRNVGTGAGEISLSGANVRYGGVKIGTLSGGDGADLTITFNANATAASIDALIENLIYSNTSDSPTASRELTLNVVDAAGLALGWGAPTITERSATANPFDGFDAGTLSRPAFADIDGDGDQDMISGTSFDDIKYYENTGSAASPAYVERTGTSNPFSGFDVIRGAPVFVDLDNDDDLDLVMGRDPGDFRYFENTGSITAPAYVSRTGVNNPLNGFDVGTESAPTFADIDGDGDADMVSGEFGGALLFFENTGTTTSPSFVQRTGSANPFSGFDVGDVSTPALADVDGDGDFDLVSGDQGYGEFHYFENTGSTTAPSFVERTGTSNPWDGFDAFPASAPTFADIDGDGLLEMVSGEFYGVFTTYDVDHPVAPTITVNVTARNDAPELTGLDTPVTFNENDVNAAPVLLDAGVTFSDGEGNFDGGSVTVTGLLAEDTVSVNNEGSGAGEIGLSGADVTFGGVTIGTLAGGAGGDLTITLNANATSAAIDALIQNLTYANSSDTPTASRELVIDVTDAAGASLTQPGVPTVTEQTGTANPFNGINAGYYSSPHFADLDGDGDLDMIDGNPNGDFDYFENTGSATAPSFVRRTGAANPFNGIDIGVLSSPVFADLDGDGDFDVLSGDNYGAFFYLENTGTASAPSFVQRTGTANPMNGVNAGHWSQPDLADIDGDGDLDLIAGVSDGSLVYYENTGSTTAPAFAAAAGTSSPFFGLSVGSNASPTFADVDRDGDLDLVLGDNAGAFSYFENTGSTTAPSFVERTGTANPFDGFDVGILSNPVLVDLDGDDRLELISGEWGSGFHFYELGYESGEAITVNVTAQNDAPEATGLPSTLNFHEDTSGEIDLSGVTLSDADSSGSVTLTLSVSAGSITMPWGQPGGGVTLAGGGTDTLTVTGTISAINTFLGAAPYYIHYAPVAEASGSGAATLSVTNNDGDGSGDVLLGTVDIDIAAENDAPELTGLATTVSFDEDTVNASGQVLDASVSFADVEGDLDGGALTVTGLLAEDVVSVQNVGTGAGEIGLSGSDVSYGGVTFATLSGGAGGDLTITFNASATAEMVEALVENLTYANTSDTPTASRTLTIDITDAEGASLTSGPPTAAVATGTANPFSGLNVGSYVATPELADVDGDGDLDLIAGSYLGFVSYFENTGSTTSPSFVARTGTANPFDAVSVGSYSAPRLVDLDGDDDLDLVVGASDGGFRYYENTGSTTAPAYVEKTNVSNPLFGFSRTSLATPDFLDVDGDGDIDVVSGDLHGLRIEYYLENTGSTTAPSFVERTGTANPFNSEVVALGSAPTAADVDGDGDTDIVIGSHGAGYVYYENVGSQTAPVFVTRTGAVNPFDGIALGSRTRAALGDIDGDGALELVSGNMGGGFDFIELTLPSAPAITVNVAAQNDAPELTGLDTPVTFNENDVNAGPQRLDTNVVFADGEGNFDGGTLTVTGLLAEDTVSVRNVGSGAGEIGLSGSDVTFGGVTIGTLAGGAGGDLTITFNASATSAAIDALLENLTYANASDTPTASRTLTLNITDAAGDDLATGDPTVTERTGTANPLNGVDVGYTSRPSFADLDGDGDLDLIAGHGAGGLRYFENTGSTTAPSFVERTGTANPVGAITHYMSAAYFADIDGDADLDLVDGDFSGSVRFYENTGSTTAPAFVERTGTANPFNGFGSSYRTVPQLVDLDGDNDLDLVVGEVSGLVQFYENTGTASAPSFVQRTGTANPFNGIDAGIWAASHLADVDGDGDQDLVLGGLHGELQYFENTGSTTSPSFVERTGTANPFDGIDVGGESAPSLQDIDGDGALELVVGNGTGVFSVFDIDPPAAPTVTVNVTAQNDAPELTGLAASVTLDEDDVNAAPVLLDTSVGFSDPEGNLDGGTLTLTGLLAEDTVSVRNVGTGAGEIGLSGSDVTYGGVTIGTLAGGAGGDLTITFNASATSAAVDALLENLTYANASDAPTASRDLVINITDAAGDDLGPRSGVNLVPVAQTGTANPFDTHDAGVHPRADFADIDGDGDLDLMAADFNGNVRFLENTGSATAPSFVRRTGTANPFDGLATLGSSASLSFWDLDGDGDLDFVAGEISGSLTFYENTGSSTAPAFQRRTGTANPFNGFDVGYMSTPTLVDIDGDGDADLFAGSLNGVVRYYENTGSTTAPSFVERTITANPLDGAAAELDNYSTPVFLDADGDGDLDAVIGESGGNVEYFENTGSTTAPSFVRRTGSANPFDGVSAGAYNAQIAAGDVDGDGVEDLIVSTANGFDFFRSGVTRGEAITVNVTAQNDAPELTGLDTSVTFLENTVNASAQIIDASVGFTDAEGNLDGGTLTVTGLLAEDVVSVRHVGTGAGEIGLSGSDVTYGGVTIGTLSGVNGADLTITFNASATSAAVDALLQNLTYANSSNEPTASRDLVITVTDSDGAVNSPGGVSSFTQRTGTGELFGFVNPDGVAVPAFADMDGDGDLDLIAGSNTGELRAFQNTGTTTNPAFTERTGTNNPFNGISVGTYSTPTAGDIDGDGDLDLFVGNSTGTLTFIRNNTTTGSSSFAEVTGTGNPFDGMDFGTASTPTLVDIDGDGDLDLAVAARYAATRYFENTGTRSAPSFVERTGADNPFEGIYSGFKPALTTHDIDGDGDLDVVQGEFYGQLFYYENTGSSTAPSLVQRTGSANPFNGIDSGFNSAVGFIDIDGDGVVEMILGDSDGFMWTFDGEPTEGHTVTVNVTAENDAPELTGLRSSVTFGENDVNAGGQLLDASVGFSDAEGNLDGGTLTVTGLLAEDVISVRNVGTGAGEIGLSGSNVTYGGVTIGTLSGGNGADLSITFNASATSAAVDALIENLTYANTSDTPTASRDLLLNITDAAGDSLESTAPPTVTEVTGAASPFDGLSVGGRSQPTAVDLDGDGDLDLVSGSHFVSTRYFENTGSTTAPSFVERTGTANPFVGLGVSLMTLVDLDDDGDFDLVGSGQSGDFKYFENTGSATSPSFIERTGTANPLDGIDVGDRGVPTFADLDGDGDLELISGELYGDLAYYENTGSATAPAFGGSTIVASSIVYYSSPAMADVDGDGDLDMVSGQFNNRLSYFENTGSTTAPSFVERTGTANPFSGIALQTRTNPVFADFDGDGDLELAVGDNSGQFFYYEIERSVGQTITVNVTAENDAPELTGLRSSVTFLENTVNASAQILDSDVALSDPDADFDGGALTVTGLLAEDYVGVNNEGSGAGEIGVEVSGGVWAQGPAEAPGLTVSITYGGVTIGTLDGGVGGTLTITFNDQATVEAIEALIENLVYANGSNEPTESRDLVIAVTDSDGASSGGDTITVNVTPEGDAPELSDFRSAVTFNESDVNAADGQLLDATVDFSNFDDDFDGAALTVAGLLAEDQVSVRDIGTAAGEIGVSGSDITYGGTVIGTASGGAGGDLTITFNSAASAAAIDALIEALAYRNTSDTPTGARTLTLTIGNAAGFDTGGVDITVNVTAEDDAAVAADDAVTVFADSVINGDVNDDNGSGADSDAEGDAFQVTAVNGAAIHVGQTISLASGALLTLNADGTFSYDPNGAFDELPAAGSGASNTSAIDSFTYEITGGDTATVTVTVNGVDDADRLEGTAGDDILYGGDGADAFYGFAGDDVFMARAGDVRFVGAGGNDKIVIHDQNLDLTGALIHKVERIDGKGRGIIINAGQLDRSTRFDDIGDITIATSGLTELGALDSGSGRVFAHTGDDTISLAGGRGWTVFAREGDDVVTGSRGADEIHGQAGADTLSGGDGDDILDGGLGADSLRGGAGFDTLYGGAGEDDLRGGTGADTVHGGDDADTIYGGAGNDTLNGDAGDDFIQGNQGDDTITGGDGADLLRGGAGDDTLDGGAGDDTLFGQDGRDVITGGAGDDVVTGGAGRDILRGGAGSDTFVYTAVSDSAAGGLNRDRIRDFTNDDLIDLSAIDADAGTAGDQAFTFVNAFTGAGGEVMFDASAEMVLIDVDGDSVADMEIDLTGRIGGVTADDFIL